MFKAIVRFSIRKKLFVGLTTLFLLIGGIYAMLTLPIDAVPDITNNQVQIVTVSPTLAPQEVEQLITMPIELAMSNIMNVEDIRSVSRFGLSVVTVVFKESVPTLDARQLINEQIQTVAGEIPPELGTPEMMPITTGLGEIYQYILKVAPGYEKKYDAMELRTIQDWMVKRQLSGIPGIVEINSFGGYLKQYEVAVDPDALFSLNITIGEVFDALSSNNQNTGSSYIEKVKSAYYIRSEGMITRTSDIEQIVVANRNGIPIHISDVGTVRFGSPKRFGAMTMDGEGECVGGIAMMLKGANANVVTQELEKRVEKIQHLLPEGVSIEPYLNRSELVNRNISTVVNNLIEGALIVFFVLILFLGNVRAGLIVASVIPLAMLFAFIMMRIFNVTANLMSLGAIDFGIVVDGSIVIVEGILAHIYGKQFRGRTLTREEMDAEVEKGASSVVRSATFAVLIILIVFFPILTLNGIEGKYFTPMAKTLVFCIIGALILSLTYVPMMASLFLKHTIVAKPTLADRFFEKLNNAYQRCLHFCLRYKWRTVTVAFAMLIGSIFLFTRLGAEFIPTLDEGDFAMQMTLPAGSSLSESIEVSRLAEKALMDKLPEIKHVVAKIGTAEVPTDPMAVEDADVMIIMKPFKEWTSAGSRAEMVDKMKDALEPLAERAEFNFSQPIQLRFNELMTGAKADIAVKLYGEDTRELYERAREAAAYVEKVPGAADVIVEQTMGLPQLVVKYHRNKIARYGINIEELNTIIRTAYAGESSGVVFENERRFDLVVRLDQEKVADLNLDKLFVRTSEGIQIPVGEVASIDLVNGPLQINRDATKRRIVIGVNVRDADIQQVVANIQETLDRNVKLQSGYYFEYGGQFENLQNAINTLLIVIPVALMLILLILFFAFKNLTYTLMVFSTVPLSLIGGIVALWLRGLPFSISAGVGFIALFGVAVLNGILMVNHFNELRNKNTYPMTTNRIIALGTPHLLRPVFLTGLVASLGFVPMAIATSAGSEVQRPLATVVIGGLIISTVLTLLIIPVFYKIVNSFAVIRRRRSLSRRASFAALLLFLLIPASTYAQQPQAVTLQQAIETAKQNHPRLRMATNAIRQAKATRGEIVEAAPTTFSYSWGQLNGENKQDKELSFEQSLGSLLTPFYKNALVNRQIKTSTYYRRMVEKEVTAEVKRAWAYYQYAANLCAMYRDQEQMAKQLRHIGELRYQQGEITLLEKNMMTTIAADLYNRWFQAQEEEKLALARFQWSCYSEQPIIPADSTLSVFYTGVSDGSLSAAHTAYFRSQADEAKALLRVERSHFFPEISVGYTRQDILPLKNLNAWMVGVSFPIYFLPQKSKVKQARLAAASAQIQADANIRELRNKVLELEASLRRYNESLRYYTSSALKEAEELTKAANLQLQHSETGIAEYIQSISTARDIRRGYIETVYQYNVAALEYELLTYKTTYMKKIFYPFLLLALTACKENPQTAGNDIAATPAATATVADNTAQPEVDAVTSATSKPNQVSFNGRIVLPPQRQATVALTMGGVIKATSLIPGQHVAKHSVIATLENPDFISLQQTYLESHAQTEYLRAEYERQKTLSAEQAASQKKFQQSKADYLSMKSRQDAAAAQLSLLGVNPETLLRNGIQPLLEVKAPISGYAANVEMNTGRYINPGEALCEIIDKSVPMLCLTTYEKDLADMQVGSPVQFRVNGMGTETFNGKVVSIGQKVDEVNRSLEVYASIEQANPQFRPGMYVTAHIQK